MPHHLYYTLRHLAKQIEGIFGHYRYMLDDEFIFASGLQVPQAAAIFDLTHGARMSFGAWPLTLAEFVALIAYRYGFDDVRPMGHGGYAVVLGHTEEVKERNDESQVPFDRELRRVMRLVPDHHVQDVTGGGQFRPFDVQLNEKNEPIRDEMYPLLLSDIFLLPRHTTKLVFYDAQRHVAYAAGKPAVLHCQLLPQVVPLNARGLNQEMVNDAGIMLECALASLGVSVADAHGGNGGILVGKNGKPLVVQRRAFDGTIKDRYIPVVLDYGYYGEIEPKRLANVLITYGVNPAMIKYLIRNLALSADERTDLLQHLAGDGPFVNRLADIIVRSGQPRATFGRLLYHVQPAVMVPEIWVERSQTHWRTVQEATYPPLRDRVRLNTLYPAYDEIVFPQRIEEYHLAWHTNA